MICWKGHSLIKEFYDKGSSGGIVSTLSFCILKMGLADGVVCLDRSASAAHWFIAYNKSDLLKAAGSTYEYIKFDFPWAPGLAQVGKPCDLKVQFSPKISLFCSHSYRKKNIPISKHYARLPKSKIRTIFENPMFCFFCSDHIGFSSDISVGDLHSNPKINVILAHSDLGKQLLGYAVNHKYILLKKIELKELKQKQPYLWRFRK